MVHLLKSPLLVIYVLLSRVRVGSLLCGGLWDLLLILKVAGLAVTFVEHGFPATILLVRVEV